MRDSRLALGSVSAKDGSWALAAGSPYSGGPPLRRATVSTSAILPPLTFMRRARNPGCPCSSTDPIQAIWPVSGSAASMAACDLAVIEPQSASAIIIGTPFSE